MTKNFPNLVKGKDIQVQEAQRVPDKLDLKRPTPRHIITMARLKDKESFLKGSRKKQGVTYKGAPIRLSSDFSTKIFHARRYYYEIFKVMKSKNLQPRLLYSAKLSFKHRMKNKELPRQEKAKGVC